MLVWLIITITLAAIAGAVLITIGWRGRPVSSDPVCKRCGFDLRGRFPWSAPTCPTCPDCGELLLTYKSVLNGERRRRPRLLVAGCGLVFPAIVILLANGVDAVAGGTLATIKPTPLVAAQVAGSTRASANLRALTIRIAEGRTQVGDTAQAIERALALQADRSIALDREWLDLLDTARRRGQLTPNQLQRYFENSIDWRLLTQPGPSNGPVPFALQGLADRLAEPPSGSLPIALTVTFEEGSLDRKPLLFGKTSEPFVMSAQTTSLVPGALIEMLASAGHSAEAGTRPLRTAWKFQARSGDASGPILATWKRVMESPAYVGHFQKQRSTASEVARQTEMEARLTFSDLRLERDAAGVCWASFSLRPTSLPFDVVATLRVTTSDGLEYRSLKPVEITPSDPLWSLRTAANRASTAWEVRVPMDGAPMGAAALVELLPYPSPETYSLAGSVWRGEPLTFKGVPLTWSGAAPVQSNGQ